MATIVHNTTAEKERSGTGWIVALIVLLAVILLFLFAGAFFTGNKGSGAAPISNPATGAAQGSGFNVSGNVSGGATGGAAQ
jgi:hypothetical protein